MFFKSFVIPIIFLFNFYYYNKFLYLDFPLGSPISPVAPPTKNIGSILCKLNLAKLIIVIKFPKCNESLLGSYPQYDEMFLVFNFYF